MRITTAASRSSMICLAADRPSRTRHLDVEDRHIGIELANQRHRRVTIGGLADDVVALLGRASRRRSSRMMASSSARTIRTGFMSRTASSSSSKLVLAAFESRDPFDPARPIALEGTDRPAGVSVFPGGERCLGHHRTKPSVVGGIDEVHQLFVEDPESPRGRPGVRRRRWSDDARSRPDSSPTHDHADHRAHDDGRRGFDASLPHVPGVGLEPTRPLGQRILSPPRLPFRHPGRVGMRHRTRSPRGLRRTHSKTDDRRYPLVTAVVAPDGHTMARVSRITCFRNRIGERVVQPTNEFRS